VGEWRYSSTHSSTSALDWGEWSASRPGRFTPRERAPVTHWIGGWMGPRAVLDAVMKRKIPSPRRESNPRTPIVQPVAQRYTDWATTALTFKKKFEITAVELYEYLFSAIVWYYFFLYGGIFWEKPIKIPIWASYKIAIMLRRSELKFNSLQSFQYRLPVQNIMYSRLVVSDI
jgi:hypothetical protein